MFRRIPVFIPRQTIQKVRRWSHSSSALLCVLLLVPVAAHAQSGSPFDTGFTNLQTLFTGTVAKVASLIAALYTSMLAAEWVWKKVIRPFAVRHGWAEPRKVLTATDWAALREQD